MNSGGWRTRTGLILMFFALALLTAGGDAPAGTGNDNDGSAPVLFAQGRVLVKFHSGVTLAGSQRAMGAVKGQSRRKLSRLGVHIVELPGQANERAALRILRARPEVEFAELDVALPPGDVVPNDPKYSSQWHLQKINGPTAWSTTTGSTGLIIAICDTGVDATHPDLASKIVAGWNFYDGNSDTSDVHGHGTAVAGTAAAISDNSTGVASVAWGCKIMPLRVTDASGYALFSTIAEAITYGADNGARVANVSFRASGSYSVRTAAKYFREKGGLVAVAAGNDGAYDSSADSPDVITVSAVDSSDTASTWTNTGNNIDLAAPGVGIYTTNRGGGFGSWSGTSFSAPIVAGVAALVFSANSDLTPDEAEQVLEDSAKDLGGTGWDSIYGWGRVDAAAAVALALATSGGGEADTTPPTVVITSPSSGGTVSGTTTVNVSATDGGAVASVQVTANNISLGTVTAAPYAFTWNTTAWANGSCTLVAKATDAAGNTSTKQIQVTVANNMDILPPVISFQSPQSGATLSKRVTVRVTAIDSGGVARMELYLDGKLVKTAYASSLVWNWNLRKVSSGTHTLLCKAFDTAGNTASRSIAVGVGASVKTSTKK